jgi:hypothetical protein
MANEIPKQARMDLCMVVERAIMDGWRKSGTLNYTARATAPIDGLTLDQLRNQHFVVGVGDDLVEVPLIDLLTIFSILEKEIAALKEARNLPQGEYRVNFEVAPDFSDEEATLLLAGIRIETPFDKGKFLRVAVGPTPPSSAGGSQQPTA